MGNVSTYTAVPCAQSIGATYEIAVTQAAQIPLSNLAAVRISENPDSYTCCTVDRGQMNSTPEEDVKLAKDSGYSTSDCSDCNDHWSS